MQQFFLFHQKPYNFNPYDPDSVIMAGERSFEEICAVLEENGVMQPRTLSEFEFYSKLRYYEKKFKSKS